MTSMLTKLHDLLAAASPYPWNIEPSWEVANSGEGFSVKDASGGSVAECESVSCYPEGCSHYGLSEADARLIALAPTLARLVRSLTETLEGNAELHHKSHWATNGPPITAFADCDDDRCWVNRKALLDAEELKP